jgi:hypothetical protein
MPHRAALIGPDVLAPGENVGAGGTRRGSSQQNCELAGRLGNPSFDGEGRRRANSIRRPPVRAGPEHHLLLMYM